MIPSNIIEEIKFRNEIENVISQYVSLKRAGSNYSGLCPFHSEKTASFQVDADKKFYYCFGCHAAGDVIKFTMEMEHLSYPDAITSLAKKSGIPIKYDKSSANYDKDQAKQQQIQETIEQNINLYY